MIAILKINFQKKENVIMNIETITTMVGVLLTFALFNTTSIILGYMIVSSFKDILVHIRDIKETRGENE